MSGSSPTEVSLRLRRVLVAVGLTASGLAAVTLTGCSAIEVLSSTSEDPTSVSTTSTATANAATHYDPADYVWDEADVVDVALHGDSATSESSGVEADGGTVTVTASGTYRFTGTLSAGQIVVETADEEVVRLILNGVAVSNPTGAAIYVADAEKVVIALADGTDNHLADGATYSAAAAQADEPNATLYSTADLTIFGEGSLTVVGHHEDGIASNDGLIITSGAVTVDAVDDGIRGKDYLVVNGGTVTASAGGDGLKSDNEEDASKGYVSITDGAITVISDCDGIDAATDVIVNGGSIDVDSGGGSSASIAEDASAKGIKGTASVVVSAGSIRIDSADDATHSNATIGVSGGTLVLSSADDAMHADTSIEVAGGDITISEAYEGIEAADITVSDGDIRMTCDDDGLNAGGGADASGATVGPGARGRDRFSTTPGGESAGDYLITITGGTIAIDAEGDGLDSNGSIEMSGGTVVVNGPSRGGNGALDCNGTFDVSGGLVVASSSAADMVESISSPSTQAVIVVSMSTVKAGTPIHLESADGTSVLTFAPVKDMAALVFTSPDLIDGAIYSVYLGGSATGDSIAGLYADGACIGGEKAGSTKAYVP